MKLFDNRDAKLEMSKCLTRHTDHKKTRIYIASDILMTVGAAFENTSDRTHFTAIINRVRACLSYDFAEKLKRLKQFR